MRHLSPDTFTHPNGAVSVYTSFPFRQIVRVENCPCGDGARRLVTITGEPDSVDSVPAFVNAQGRRIRGFLTSAGFPFPHAGVRFVAYGMPSWCAAWRDARVMAEMTPRPGGAKTPARRLLCCFPGDFL